MSPISDPVGGVAVQDSPASFAQQRFWLAHGLSENPALLNGGAAFQVTGPLNIGALTSALAAVVRRHEILRTGLVLRDGAVVQQVHTAPASVLAHVRLGSCSPQLLQDCLHELGARPFQLDYSPLFRCALFELSPARFVFAFVAHHIVCDGFSVGILATEVETLYRAAIGENRPALPELPLQYKDYARRQYAVAQPDTVAAAQSYWRGKLAGAPERNDLGSPTAGTVRMHTILIDAHRAAQIREFARRQRATPFMVLLAAWNALLFRYSGQMDVVTTTPVAGRNSPELASLIGSFINLLPLRVQVSGSLRFSELISGVRRTCLEAFAYQELPFQQIVEALGPGAHRNGNPFQQVVFGYQDQPRVRFSLPHVKTEVVDLPPVGLESDVSLSVLEDNGGWRWDIQSASGVFDAALWDRLPHHLMRILDSAVEDPQSRLHELPMLDEQESRQLLKRGGAGALTGSAPLAHRCFEAQAEIQPAAIAAEYGHTRLTYSELNARAAGLACSLRVLGAGPDCAVGLLVDRSLNMLVAVLGILKAGAAYVPLDPVYPPERLEYMLERAGVRILLTESSYRDKAGAFVGTVVELDQLGEPCITASERNANVELAPGNLAYVIFTSGSTGRPKGVMITHGNLASFLASMRQMSLLVPGDTILAITTLCFDIAALELLLPLTLGGRVVIAPRDVSTDPLLLAAALERCGATAMQATPATWQGLVDSGWPGRPGLKILCGGEALSPSLAAALLRRGGFLWNLYGPTETTIWSSVGRLTPSGRVHVGAPLANARFHILDEWLHARPAGAVGELYISGQGVARGYVGSPGLTAERFLPGPDGERLYRTGDLARYRSDGTLEMLGRVDHQVKIRGFRVELGEIEARLCAHPRVTSAVASAWRDANGEDRLVAYVVVSSLPPPEPRELRHFLASALPEYMLPSDFVCLPSFPLNANGKVDRKSLPDPASARASGSALTKTPQTAAEELVAGVFATVLGVDKVDSEANFFEIGGHSLSGTRVMARLREIFNISLPLRALFEAPTPPAMARRISAQLGMADAAGWGSVTRGPRDGNPPLSFAQQRLWFLHRMRPDGAAYNLSASMRLFGNLDLPGLNAALRTVTRRHEALRTRFPDDTPAQVIDPPGEIRLPLVDLTGIADPDPITQRLIRDESSRRFDLARKAPWRCLLIRTGPRLHTLCLTIHHIAFDDASIELLMQEVESLYNSRLTRSPAVLPDLPVQYQDYAWFERRHSTAESFEHALAYWREQLAGLPPLELSRGTGDATDGREESTTSFLRLDASLTDRIRQLSRREGLTTFMTILASLQAMLARYSRQEDFAIGVPVSGRIQPELDPLIGLFVNTVVLRADLSGDPSFREILGRVRSTTLDALAHAHLPFDKLVTSLHASHHEWDHSLFRVMVVQQHPRRSVSLHGLETEWLAAGEPGPKVDLEFLVTDGSAGIEIALRCRRPFEDVIGRDFFGRWRSFLQRAVSDPEMRIWTAGILDDTERHQLLGVFNATSVEHGARQWIHEQFERQAACHPEAPALVWEERTLTYSEINTQANRLAHRLARHGVRRGSIVSVMAERSIDMVVALLGILKAGAAYLPLDPRCPVDRVGYILEDAASRVLLTAQVQPAALDTLATDVIDVASTISQSPAQNPGLLLDPADLAYVIYTSGSTGRPKGVMISHGALHNRLAWMGANYPIGPGDAVLQKTPYTFDVSVWEFFWPLAVGATLVIARPDGHRDPAYLWRLMEQTRVTTVHFVPSMLRAFLAAIEGPMPSSLRRVFSSGEELPRDLASEFIRRCPVELHNLYGPTEAAVDVSFWDCRLTSRSVSVPIGCPIWNVQLYVLDHWLNLMPPGAPGELFIGGAGLARGYLHRPDLTADRFLPNPFSAHAGERLYRTGDLARFLPDGALEFLGRVDEQVKIRGVRIEPGEVVAALRHHPGVQDAAVVARSGPDGDQRLIAYVVAELELQPRDLREALLRKLPEYMVPAGFVALDELPLNPNGKLDRKALPEPRWPSGGDKESRAFDNDVALALAAIWADVLGLERVGPNDNFFDLGGDSILGIQVVARAARQGMAITPADMFQYQTIAELAPFVKGSQPDAPAEAFVRSAPLTPIQEWFFEARHAVPNHFNQALWFELMPPYSPEELERAVVGTVMHHNAFGLRFHHEDRRWHQHVAEGFARDLFSRIDLSAFAEPWKVAERIAAEVQASLDIVHGPLFRAVLLEAGLTHPARVLFLAHHLVIDAVSWRILFDDLQVAFEQVHDRKPVALGATAAYTAWSVRLRDYVAAGKLDGELTFWLDQSRGPGALLSPAPAAGTCSSAAVVAVDIDLTGKERLAKHGSTVQQFLVAALFLALREWAGRSSFRIDVEGHGREYVVPGIDVSRTVGWFTTLYPLTIGLGRDTANHAEVLSTVGEHLRRVPGGGLGYGALRYLSQAGKPLANHPPADLCFNYLGRVDTALNRGGPLRPVDGPLGALVDTRNICRYPLEVNALIRGSRLHVAWTYNVNRYARAAVDQLTQLFESYLLSLLALGAEHTDTYFPQGGLSEREFARLTEELKEV